MSHQPQRRVKGIAIHRSIVYGSTATYLVPSERLKPDHSHRWTVAVRSAASPPPGKRGEVQQIGGYDDISHFIRKVSFKLHETYPTPLRGRPYCAKSAYAIELILSFVYSHRQASIRGH